MADEGTKYRQIADDIRADIVSGRLPAGARVPGENALMERYSVARMTARQALAVLREEGVVDVRRGAGTFVRASSPELSGSVAVPSELLEALRSRHGLGEAELLHVLPRVRLRLVEGASGWSVEYRVLAS